MRFVVGSLLAASLLATPAIAQTTSSSSGCNQATAAQPATPPAQGSTSGTAPGGMGSTAWSGGTGGSYVGTNPQGSASGSSAQPATAQGMDPTKPSAPTNQKC